MYNYDLRAILCQSQKNQGLTAGIGQTNPRAIIIMRSNKEILVYDPNLVFK